MPIAKVVRLQPLNNGYNTELEISGFKLFYGNDEIDLSVCAVTANFIPSQGSLDFFKRTTIIENEAVVLTTGQGKGGSFIYLTFPTNIEFDAFQIGFGSSIEKSLLKFSIGYSTNGTSFKSFTEVSGELRLKYSNPFTFSNLLPSNTGYPGFFDMRPGHNITDYATHAQYIEIQKRRHFGSRVTRFTNSYGSSGNRIEFPVSSFLSRGKYYFEVETETIQNNGNLSMAMSMLLTDSTDTPTFNEQRAYFGFCNRWNGVSTNFWNGSGTQNPFSNYNNYENITGFISGITVDTTNGVIRVVNSPYTADFQFGNSALINYFSNIKKRVFFIFSSFNYTNTIWTDLTLNFGQKPFRFEPPTGFDDRIGQRWEMEIDPTYSNILTFKTDNSLKDIICSPIQEFNNDIASIEKDYCLTPGFDYYIKGNISATNGSFSRKKVSLVTWPGLEVLRTQPSRDTDGLYEFIELENKPYAIISQDLLDDKLQPEILGPVFPLKMDLTNG